MLMNSEFVNAYVLDLAGHALSRKIAIDIIAHKSKQDNWNQRFHDDKTTIE